MSESHDDGVTGWPGGPDQHQVRHLELAAHHCGVRRDRRRERVGGVDDRVDVRVEQPVPQSVGPAETADAHLTHRQRGIGHPAGQ